MTKKTIVVSDNGSEAPTKTKRVRLNTIQNTLHIFIILTEDDKYVAFSKLDGKVQHMVRFTLNPDDWSPVTREKSAWLWNIAPQIGSSEGIAASYFTRTGSLTVKDVRYLTPIKELVAEYIYSVTERPETTKEQEFEEYNRTPEK